MVGRSRLFVVGALVVSVVVPGIAPPVTTSAAAPVRAVATLEEPPPLLWTYQEDFDESSESDRWLDGDALPNGDAAFLTSGGHPSSPVDCLVVVLSPDGRRVGGFDARGPRNSDAPDHCHYIAAGPTGDISVLVSRTEGGADYIHYSLRRFSADGTLVNEVSLDNPPFSSIYGLVIDSSGTPVVLLLDRSGDMPIPETYSLHALNADGTVKSERRWDQVYPTGPDSHRFFQVEIDSQDRIWLHSEDPDERSRIYRLDTFDAELTTILDWQTSSVVVRANFAVDTDGSVYWSELGRIAKYDSSGTLLSEWDPGIATSGYWILAGARDGVVYGWNSGGSALPEVRAWGSVTCAVPRAAGASPAPTAVGDGTIAVGSWAAQGCFRKVGDVYSSRDEVMLNGLTLTPSSGEIRVNPTTERLSSTGPVVVSLSGREAGTRVGPIRLSNGQVSWDLSKRSVRFAIKHFLDLPVVDKTLTVTVLPEGKANLDLQVGVPALFGTRSIRFDPLRLSNTSGLQVGQLRWQSDRVVGVSDLLPLRRMWIDYDPDAKTWAAGAQVVGAPVEPEIGFRYRTGELVWARVTVPRLDLAGLVTVRNLTVAYGSTRGTGGARSPVVDTYSVKARPAVGDTLAGKLVYTDGELTRFAVTADLSLFSSISVKAFRLAWTADDGWSGSGRAVIADTDVSRPALDVTVTLRSENHRIVGGRIDGTVIRLGAGPASFRLEDLRLAYSRRVDDAGVEHETWSGGALLRFPGSDAPGVGGSVTFTDGRFRTGTVSGRNIRLGPVVTFTSIDATAELDPLALRGDVTARFGPDIIGADARISGSLLYKRSNTGGSDLYQMKGRVTVADARLLDAQVTHLTSGRTTFEGEIRFGAGPVTVANGSLVGYVDSTTFYASGRALIDLGIARARGRVQIGNRGITGCLTIPGTDTKAGFTKPWDGPLTVTDDTCNTSVIVPSNPA